MGNNQAEELELSDVRPQPKPFVFPSYSRGRQNLGLAILLLCHQCTWLKASARVAGHLLQTQACLCRLPLTKHQAA
jgi:hypothetical protein